MNKISYALDETLGGIKAAMFRPINKSASVILGLFSIVWGFWVGNPWWSVFETATLFRAMDHVFDETVWGVAAVVIGVLIIVGMLKSKFFLLRIGTAASFYFWTFVSICFLIGDWHNTGGITIATIALYSGYVTLNLSINKNYYLEQ